MSDKEKSRGSNEERQKEIKDIEMKEYYSDILSNKRNKQTHKGYRETFLMLEEWMEENQIESWQELQPSHITFLNNYLSEERGLYGSTIDRHLDRLRAFFRDKNKDELVEKTQTFDKTTEQLYQKKTGEEVLYLEIPEYKQILDATETLREKLVIQILWETGMRRSELTETTLQKVDLENKEINVDNKKNSKTRPIPYSSELQPTLREWIKYGGRDQYSKASESEYLLISQKSEQVRPAFPNKVVRRVADRTDVSYSYGKDASGRNMWFPTAHHFRHSYATHRASSGMNLKKLSRLMGHRHTEQTARYVGVKGDDLADANEKHRPKTYDLSEELSRNI